MSKEDWPAVKATLPLGQVPGMSTYLLFFFRQVVLSRLDAFLLFRAVHHNLFAFLYRLIITYLEFLVPFSDLFLSFFNLSDHTQCWNSMA